MPLTERIQVNMDENGSQVMLTLYWQARQKPDFDYSAFVHLVDASDQLVAQMTALRANNGYPQRLVARRHYRR